MTDLNELERELRKAVAVTRRHQRAAMVALENVRYGQLGFGNGATLATVYRELELAQHAAFDARNLIMPTRMIAQADTVTQPPTGECIYCGHIGPLKNHMKTGDMVCTDDDACLARGWKGHL